MFTSYRIIELVRKHISTEHLKASDTDVARAMGISRAAVSAYKTGRDVMTHETLARAQPLLGLPDVDVANIGFDLLLEQAKSDNARAIYKSMREIARHATTWAKSRGASILLVCLGLLTVHGKASAADVGVELVGDCQTTTLYIMRNWTRRRRQLAKLFPWLKALVAAPLNPPCARNRSTASAPQSWRRSVACT